MRLQVIFSELQMKQIASNFKTSRCNLKIMLFVEQKCGPQKKRSRIENGKLPTGI